MSIQAVGWALGQRVGSASAKAVLVAIANYADENGLCWPSQQKLGQDTELSERAIRTALVFLGENGFITRTARRRQDGGRSADLIEVVLQPAAGAAPPVNGAAPPPANGSKQPAADAAPPGSRCPPHFV